MAVDTTPVITGNRRSIRITTNYQFTGGLLVLDAVHVPTGFVVVIRRGLVLTLFSVVQLGRMI